MSSHRFNTKSDAKSDKLHVPHGIHVKYHKSSIMDLCTDLDFLRDIFTTRALTLHRHIRSIKSLEADISTLKKQVVNIVYPDRLFDNILDKYNEICREILNAICDRGSHVKFAPIVIAIFNKICYAGKQLRTQKIELIAWFCNTKINGLYTDIENVYREIIELYIISRKDKRLRKYNVVAHSEDIVIESVGGVEDIAVSV
ncbi:MAG: hypothetical protein Faunusvirus14_10 [Faunusvirus sp.]|jgi:hypothetical protein|uniref:Uncharacterized protein n=1 Tax=Faunusvirus sp. TaxID=2487766 RepID=A0A3G5A0S5_9VIRU|nr:MAG: hypothetical protein Faunusvirus14_10 [Faunusvirus sp.]